MPEGIKTYATASGTIVDVPESKIQAFKNTFKDAYEVVGVRSKQGEGFIPVTDFDGFVASNPDTEPLDNSYQSYFAQNKIYSGSPGFKSTSQHPFPVPSEQQFQASKEKEAEQARKSANYKPVTPIMPGGIGYNMDSQYANQTPGDVVHGVKGGAKQMTGSILKGADYLVNVAQTASSPVYGMVDRSTRKAFAEMSTNESIPVEDRIVFNSLASKPTTVVGDWANTLNKSGAEDIMQAPHPKVAESFAMLPQIIPIAAAMTIPGAQVTILPMFGLMGAGSGLQQYEGYLENKIAQGQTDQSYDPDIAFGIAVLSAGIEAGSEQLGSVARFVKGKNYVKAMQGLATKELLETTGGEGLKQITKNFLAKNPQAVTIYKKWLLNPAEEAFEEVAAQIGSYGVNAALYNKDANWKELGEQTWQAALGGFVMGGILTGYGNALTTMRINQAREANKNLYYGITKEGETFEILGRDGENLSVLNPNGESLLLPESTFEKTISLSPQEASILKESVNLGNETAQKAIESTSPVTELQNKISPVINENGTHLISNLHADGNPYFIKSGVSLNAEGYVDLDNIDPARPPIVLDKDGNLSNIPFDQFDITTWEVKPAEELLAETQMQDEQQLATDGSQLTGNTGQLDENGQPLKQQPVQTEQIIGKTKFIVTENEDGTDTFDLSQSKNPEKDIEAIKAEVAPEGYTVMPIRENRTIPAVNKYKQPTVQSVIVGATVRKATPISEVQLPSAKRMEQYQQVDSAKNAQPTITSQNVISGDNGAQSAPGDNQQVSSIDNSQVVDNQTQQINEGAQQAPALNQADQPSVETVTPVTEAANEGDNVLNEAANEEKKADIERRRRRDFSFKSKNFITGERYSINISQKFGFDGFDVDVSQRDDNKITGFIYNKTLSQHFDTIEEAKEYAEEILKKDKDYSNKINAKYDAELAALESTPEPQPLQGPESPEKSSVSQTHTATPSELNKTGIDDKAIADLKQNQLDIILKSNPMLDDIHTGIRVIDNILTAEEAFAESINDGEGATPDFTIDDIQEALKTGKILVYSSYPIKNGVFVSPSRMQAEAYSGNGKIYSKEVSLSDIAWIDQFEGQYAKAKKSPTQVQSEPITQNDTQEGINNDTPAIELKPKKRKSFWQPSKEAKALAARDPESPKEAVLQYFVTGGTISEKDYENLTGFNGKNPGEHGYTEKKDHEWMWNENGTPVDELVNSIETPMLSAYIDSYGVNAIQDIVQEIIQSHDNRKSLQAELASLQNTEVYSEEDQKRMAADAEYRDMIEQQQADELQLSILGKLIEEYGEYPEELFNFDSYEEQTGNIQTETPRTGEGVTADNRNEQVGSVEGNGKEGEEVIPVAQEPNNPGIPDNSNTPVEQPKSPAELPQQEEVVATGQPATETPGEIQASVSGETLDELYSELDRLNSLPESPENDKLLDELRIRIYEAKLQKAASETNTNPTEAQQEAGNYKKGVVNINGMEIAIENPVGSTRSGTDEDGKAWEHVMKSHYGYFKRTKGKDGDQIDCFIGEFLNSPIVYVVDQNKPDTGEFDESKVMLGFTNPGDAKEAYLENYDKDWKGFGSITPVTIEDFKVWLKDGKRQNKAFGEYKDTPEPVSTVAKTATAQPKFAGELLNEMNAKKITESDNNSLSLQEPTLLPDGKAYKTSQGETIRYTTNEPNNSGQYGLWEQDNTNSNPDTGEFCAVERLLNEQKHIDLTGPTKIKSPDDVAFLFRHLEDASSENAFAVFINKDKSYKVLYLSTGSTVGTVIDTKFIALAAKEFNAESVTFVHNHPSGNLVTSDADVNLHKRTVFALKGICKVNPGVIINLDSGKYAEFGFGDWETKQVDYNQKASKVKVYQFDKQKLYIPSAERKLIKGSREVAQLLSKIKRGTDKKYVILVLDRRNNVTRALVDNDISPEHLLPIVAKHGEAVIISGNNNLDRSQIIEIKTQLQAADISFLDYLQVEPGADIISAYRSYADEGDMNEPETKYETGTVYESKPRFAGDALNQILKQSEIGFYSTVDKALNSIQQSKGTPEQFKAMLLKNGAKQAEMDWMDFDGNFSDKKSVTKQEVQDWIDGNKIEVKEVTKGQEESPEITRSDFDTVEQIDTHTYIVHFKGDIRDVSTHAEGFNDAVSSAIRTLNKERVTDNTKFSQYVLPGGENYKEILLTMPTRWVKQKVRVEPITINGKEYWKTINENTGREDIHGSEYSAYNLKTLQEREGINESGDFSSSHFDEKNIIAHVRINDRTDTQGRRILFLEELQSDWNQKIKKEGYKIAKSDIDKMSDEEAIKLYEQKYPEYDVVDNNDGSINIGNSTFERNDAIDRIKNILKVKQENAPPANPFMKTDQWLNLAFRRIIRYAADNGYDAIAWTNGEQQSERYDLSKKLSYIQYDPYTDIDTGKPTGEYNVRYSTGTAVESDADYDAKGLEDTFGKEIANKIINNEGEKNTSITDTDGTKFAGKVLQGDDLKITANGMRSFYDNIVPSAANKLGKAFGSKVEEIQMSEVPDLPHMKVDKDPESFFTVQSLPITPSMRESVLGGVPLFHNQPQQTTKTKPTHSEVKSHAEKTLANLNINTQMVIVDKAEELRTLYVNEGASRQLLAQIDGVISNPYYDGFFDPTTRKIVIITSRVNSLEQTESIVNHESVHATNRNFLGARRIEILNFFHDLYGEQNALDYLSESYSDLMPFDMADEVIAYTVQEMIDNNTIPTETPLTYREIVDIVEGNTIIDNFTERLISTIYHETQTHRGTNGGIPIVPESDGIPMDGVRPNETGQSGEEGLGNNGNVQREKPRFAGELLKEGNLGLLKSVSLSKNKDMNTPEYKLAEQIQQILESRGIDKSFSVSNTDFGQSIYFTVYSENNEPILKIRISDHGVSNYNRIFNEQHESAKSDPERIANNIELAMFPERYDKIQTGTRYYSKHNNNWITEPISDGKAWVKSYNSEATEKMLDGLNPQTTRIVSKEFIRESKSGNKIYNVTLENLTDVGEVPVYKYVRKNETNNNSGSFDTSNPSILLHTTPPTTPSQPQFAGNFLNNPLQLQGKRIIGKKDYGDRFADWIAENVHSVDLWQQEMKKDGFKALRLFDVYSLLRRRKGLIKGMIDKFDEGVFTTLEKNIARMIDKYKISSKEIQLYLKAKSAIERNDNETWIEYRNKLDKEGYVLLDENDDPITYEIKHQIKAISDDPDDKWGRKNVEKIIKDFETKIPKAEVKKLWEDIKASTDFTINTLYLDGVITKEDHTKYTNRKYYVPLRGWEFDENNSNPEDFYDYVNNEKNGINSQTYVKATIKAKGRTSEPGDPFPYIRQLAHSAVMTSVKNRISRTALQLFRVNQNDPKVTQYMYVKSPFKGNSHEAKRTRQTAEKHEIIGYDNGDRFVLVIGDPHVAQSIKGENVVLRETAKWLGESAFGKLTQFMKANFTGKNPNFFLNNFLFIDVPYAAITEGIRKEGEAKQFVKQMVAGKPFKTIHRDITEKLNPLSKAETLTAGLNSQESIESAIQQYGESRVYDTLYEMWKDAGGPTGWMQLESFDKSAKKIEQEINRIRAKEADFGEGITKLSNKDKFTYNYPLRKGAELMDYIMKMSEQSSRFAVFVSRKMAGQNTADAALASKEATVDFDRTGQASTVFNQLFAFFKPTISATYGIYKMGKANKEKFGYALGSFFALGVLQAILAYMSFPDDNDKSTYDQVPDYDKLNNLIFPRFWDEKSFSEGKYVKIPLPQFFRAIYALGITSTQAAMGKMGAGELVMTNLRNLTGALTPFNVSGEDLGRTLVPTAVTPAYDIAVNETFSGRPVYKEMFTKDLEDKTPESQKGLKSTFPPLVEATQWWNEVGGGNDYTKAGSGLDPVTGIPQENKTKELVFDWNPAKMQHVFETVGGGRVKFFRQVFSTGMAIATPEKDLNDWDIPLFYRYLGRTKDSNPRQAYYSAQRAVKEYKYYINSQKKQDPAEAIKMLSQYGFMNELSALTKYTQKNIDNLQEQADNTTDAKSMKAKTDSIDVVAERFKTDLINLEKKYNITLDK